MISNEFDLAVVGDEPGGLWFMHQAQEVARLNGDNLRILWITFEGPTGLFVPSFFLHSLSINAKDPQSLEIVTPRGLLSWDESTLKEKFAHLPQMPWEPWLRDAFFGKKREIPLGLRYALRQHPELISFAQGVWRVFGRSRDLQPETLLAGALSYASFSHWDPAQNLGEAFTVLKASPRDQLVGCEAKVKQPVRMTFGNHVPITATRWVFNTSHSRLNSWTQNVASFGNLFLGPVAVAPKANFFLHLTAESSAIPVPVRDFTLVMDNDQIPDPITEMWPIQLKREGDQCHLTLATEDRWQTSLEQLCEGLKGAMGRAQKLFPHLARHLSEVSLPLGLESCHQEEQRRELSAKLFGESQEIYTHSSLNAETRNPSVFCLSPSLFCHLPYPMGPIKEANRVLRHWMGKKKMRVLEGPGGRESKSPEKPSLP